MSTITFKPNGVLSFSTISTLQKELIKSIEGNKVVLDLSKIDKCDSAGLAFLLDSIFRFKKNDIDYQILGISPEISSLARFYEVESLLG